MRFPRLLLFASALYLLTCCSGADAGVEAGQPLRVLFIGNSYTFHNNMPEMLAQLMRAGGRDIEVQSSARGGWTLADHAASEETLSMLMSQNWEYVILQEQSVIPCIPARREQLMYPAVRAIHDEVQRAGAETVLFVTWGRRDGLSAEGYRDYEMMQDQLNSGYMEIGTEVGAVVAPVGIAWQNARTADTQLQLWDRDGSHPSQEGSYLAACVFYSVICGESPEGTGYWGGLPVGTAQFLQRIAAETALD